MKIINRHLTDKEFVLQIRVWKCHWCGKFFGEISSDEKCPHCKMDLYNSDNIWQDAALNFSFLIKGKNK